MALTRKQQSVVVASPATRYPEQIPSLPQDTRVRFPSLSDWQTKLASWWYDFRTALVRDISEILSTLSSVSSELTSYRASNDAALTVLGDRITALEVSVAGLAGASAPEDYSGAIADLQADLAAHVAGTVVHGAGGPVIGLGDAFFVVHTAGLVYAVFDYNCVILCAAAAARSVTLPTAIGHIGKIVVVKDSAGTASTGNITVGTIGGQTIDGAATGVLWIDNECIWFQSDGANWVVV